nr:uncharacterized mitochondrial protein AtMg00810-like [Tanacetum cinerariifolium]
SDGNDKVIIKGKPHLGLWYPKDSPFNLVAYSESDYAGASLDRKSTTGGCQFLGCRLISWQCKKQTVVATSSTKAEYIVAASCCVQVLWIQNQLLDYSFGLTMQVAQRSMKSLKRNLHDKVVAVKPTLRAVSTKFVKKVNDVPRLQALVDRKKVIITEATIREALRLDDAKRINCLPNEEIFTELSRMGVGKGFSGVETPLFKGMIVAQQANEGAASVDVDAIPAAAEPSIPSPTPTTQPPPPSQKLPFASQVIPTLPPLPIADPSSSPQQQQQPSQPTHDAEISIDLLHTLLETCTTLTRKVEALEQDKVAQALEIIKLKKRVKQLERKNKLKVSGLRRLRKGEIIANMDADEDVTLKDVADVEKDAEIEENADVQGRQAESQAQIYKIDLNMLTSATITVATTLITVATLTSATSAVRRRKVVIRDPEETATPSIIIHSEPKSKDKGKGIMVEEPKPLKKQVQIEQDKAYARELEAELNKNIIGMMNGSVFGAVAGECQPKNHDYYHEQNSCYDSNSIGFDQSQPQQYTVNHPIFSAHHDLLGSQKKLNMTLTTVTEQMTQLTSMCEMACQIIQKKQEEKHIEEEQVAKAQNWKLPVCYDDDDDEEGYNSLNDNIISELPSYSAVTPTKPIDSLSMGDKHLNTIPATESDEFIKSCIENLVPNPSESKGENGCDVPADFTTFSNVLFDDDYDSDSSDDQSLSDEDVPEKIYSNPLFDEEIIPMEIDQHPLMLRIDETDCHPEKEIRLAKILLYDNSSPRPLEEIISDNSNADIKSFSPSPIPNEDSDSHMEEIDLYFNPDDQMSPGIEDDDDDSERDILILEELLDNYSLSLPTN